MAAGFRPHPLGEIMRSPRSPSSNGGLFLRGGKGRTSIHVDSTVLSLRLTGLPLMSTYTTPRTSAKSFGLGPSLGLTLSGLGLDLGLMASGLGLIEIGLVASNIYSAHDIN